MEISDEKIIPVISFKFVKTDKKEQTYCNHTAVMVDEKTRTIECSNCGIILDPFEYLKETCYQEESAFTRYQVLKNEVSKLEVRWSNLTKEVERLNLIKKKIKQ